jgi:hypothetical protein
MLIEALSFSMFIGRKWKLKIVNFIDFSDGFGLDTQVLIKNNRDARCFSGSSKKMSNIKMKKTTKIIKLKISHENRLITVKRDADWNINITELAKFFNKKWQDWYKHYKKKVRSDKFQLGNKRLVKFSPGRYGSTWVTFDLAIEALNSWNSSFSYKLFGLHQQDLFEKKQKQRKRRYLLEEGSFIYCYPTNDYLRVGFSDGKHLRIKNHESSVGKFAFD